MYNLKQQWKKTINKQNEQNFIIYLADVISPCLLSAIKQNH